MPATITVAEIIDEARDFHPSFDDRALPDRACMRQVSRAERRIVEKVTSLNEQALAEEVVFRNLETALMRGLELPDHTLLLDVAYESAGVTRPVSLVAYSDRFTEGLRRFPSGYLVGSKFYPTNRTLTGETNTGWETADLIRAVMVKLPPRYTSLKQTIHLPEVAHDALVANLAHWMALRVGLPETNLLYGQSQEAENVLVQNLAERGSTSTWTVRITHYP